MKLSSKFIRIWVLLSLFGCDEIGGISEEENYVIGDSAELFVKAAEIERLCPGKGPELAITQTDFRSILSKRFGGDLLGDMENIVVLGNDSVKTHAQKIVQAYVERKGCDGEWLLEMNSEIIQTISSAKQLSEKIKKQI